MMMTLDLEKYCKYHIDLEFSHHSMKESMHHIDNLEIWTAAICKEILNRVETYRENVLKTETITISGDDSTFYDICNIILICHKFTNYSDYVKNEDEEPGVIGAYKVEESGRNSKGEYVITIVVNLIDTFLTIEQEIYVLMSHELAHAYEDYCRYPNVLIQDKKFSPTRNNIDGDIVTRILIKADANPFSKELAKMIYYTSDSERQAIVNQSFSEIIKNRFILVNCTVNDFFKSTSLYKSLKKYDEFLEKIQNLDPISEQACLAVYNELCYTHIKDYKTMLNKLTHRYTRFRNTIISKVSPILHRAWSLRNTFNSRDFQEFISSNKKL